MSLYRRAARRDIAEPAIVAALERVGADVTRLSIKDEPDLLVGYHGILRLLEVKTGKRKPTLKQAARMAELKRKHLPVAVARTPEDALQAIGAIR